ncbi:MAG: 1-deoxy-D-xylulose-5-phosphate reductoisomerase [Spirochaetes bacterium RBG_16_49_21]|nr:MAG: 1-deoxy-D-xylulose-5-phosphate reductoisomerase [Spirochaetes bacterium RBG_16_49_21]
MSKTVSILGSTGSIGRTCLRVLRFLGDDFQVYGLACGGNIGLLERQIQEFKPAAAAVGAASAVTSEEYRTLKKKYPGTEFLDGEDGVTELAGRRVDVLVSAIVGAAGLKPTLAGLDAAGRIALANKETLVMAGDIVRKRLASNGAELVPVDSEHSALFSLIRTIEPSDVLRIILTASGGSLRGLPASDLSSVTPERALEHPTWEMGSKITIDSATLMNKGFEVIEAHFLFGVEYDRIDVLLHPESIVHSLVETVDGGLYAYLSVTDMALPVLAAFMHPRRLKNPFGRLRLEEVGRLTFASCDRSRYPALDLCYAAGRRGGTLPAVLNAANEVAVNAFLEGRIPFTDIVKVVETAMERHRVADDPGIEEIFEADREARELSRSLIGVN